MERLGFGAIRPPAGMSLISTLLRSAGARTASASATSGLLPPALVASVFFWDKLKSDSRLFAELKPLPAAGAAAAAGGESVAAAVDSATGSTVAAAAGPALTAEALRAAVTAAVVSVMGEDVGADTPLVGAGLDSLGELLAFGFG